MSVRFKNYNPDPLFGEDYQKLRNFLIKRNHHNYPFGRWDWMITHSYLDKSALSNIGLWEEHGQVVAIATYDCCLGNAYLLTLEPYEFLKKELFLYAKQTFVKNGTVSILIQDGDLPLQEIANQFGFVATQKQERDAVYPIDIHTISYPLPKGFYITSMDERYDLYQYGRVLWNGFDHEKNGEGAFLPNEETLLQYQQEFERPNINLSLKIAVVAPDGIFASYCGMWYDPVSPNALVEPVATDPAFRKMGLGRAAVLEGIRRCGKLGAKQAFVGSSQQFYYQIGFRPYATATWWKHQ